MWSSEQTVAQSRSAGNASGRHGIADKMHLGPVKQSFQQPATPSPADHSYQPMISRKLILQN
jgi:hypothetical protein